MPEAIDLTQEIYTGMPVFPGHLKTIIFDHATHEETARIMTEGYSYASKGLLMCDHGPTHVDAVCHINPDPEAPCVDEMPLDTFFGPALCLDLSHVPEHSLMGPEIIQEAEKKAGLEIQEDDIVLFYTGHYDRHYPKPEYLEGYSGFSLESAVYLIEEKKIKNWGADTPRRTFVGPAVTDCGTVRLPSQVSSRWDGLVYVLSTGLRFRSTPVLFRAVILDRRAFFVASKTH